MRVVLFLIYSCFLFLQGNNFSTAAYYPDPTSSSKYIYAHGHLKAATHQEASVVSDIDEEKEYYLNDDAEEDDLKHVVAKIKSYNKYIPDFSCQSLLTYLQSCTKAPPAIYGRTSHIYILQRVLKL